MKIGKASWDQLYITIDSEGFVWNGFLYNRTQNGNLNNLECEVKWAYERIGIVPEEDSHKSIFDYLIQSHLPVHMRDKLKDEIYFDQYIAWTKDFIARLRNTLLENEDDFFKHTIYLESEKLLNAKYSRGYSICEIKEIYDWMVAQINEPWCLNTYGDQLFLISMGILLNVDKSILNKIKERLIELKEKDWLLDFFLNYEEGVDMDTFYPKLKFKNYCEKLKEIACATENQEELLTVYVTKLWYRKNRGSAWYNSHKDTQNTYFGYWCFEGAALAKLLHIPDEQLKECKYYPYDLAHYEGGN